MKDLVCAGCGETKRVPDHYKECCSKKCVHALRKRRDPLSYVSQREIAGAAAGRSSSERAVRMWAKRYPCVPVDAVRAIRFGGYHAGFRRGQETGFRQGKAAAEAQMRIAGVRTVVVKDVTVLSR